MKANYKACKHCKHLARIKQKNSSELRICFRDQYDDCPYELELLMIQQKEIDETS